MSGSIKHYILPTEPDTLGVSVELTPYLSENTWFNENWYSSDQGQTITMVTAFFLSMPALKKLRVRFADIANAEQLVYGIARSILEASTQGKGISNELIGKDWLLILPVDHSGLELVFELVKLGTGDHCKLSILLCQEYSDPEMCTRVLSTDSYFGFNNHGFRAEKEEFQGITRFEGGVINLFKIFTNMRKAVSCEKNGHLFIDNVDFDASKIVVRNAIYRGLLLSLLAEIPFMVRDHQLLNRAGVPPLHPSHRMGYHDVIGMVELGWVPRHIELYPRTFDDALAGYNLKLHKHSLSVSLDVL